MAKASVEDWYSKYLKDQAIKRDRILNELGSACNWLEDHGVTNVIIKYEGYGDSGGIEDVVYEPAVRVPKRINDIVENAAYEIMPAGFENNEGGFGTITFDISERTASLAHNENYTDQDDAETYQATLDGANYNNTLTELRKLKVESVMASYHGCGDDGTIEDIYAEPTTDLCLTLVKAIENLIYELLPDGWQDGEGSSGEVVLSLTDKAAQLTINHKANCISSAASGENYYF